MQSGSGHPVMFVNGQASPQTSQPLYYPGYAHPQFFLVEDSLANRTYTRPINYAKYRSKLVRKLGVIQIFMGLVAIGMNIGMAINYSNIFWVISAGWWGGVTFMISGSLAIVSANNANKCTLTAAMLVCFLCCLMVGGVIAEVTLAMTDDSKNCVLYCYTQTVDLALCIVLLLASLTELMTALTSAILAGQIVCFNYSRYQHPAHVAYVGGYSQAVSSQGFSYVVPTMTPEGVDLVSTSPDADMTACSFAPPAYDSVANKRF